MRSRQLLDMQKSNTAKNQANDRLARALRDNLHRRKAQARARTSAPVSGAGGRLPLSQKSPRE